MPSRGLRQRAPTVVSFGSVEVNPKPAAQRAREQALRQRENEARATSAAMASAAAVAGAGAKGGLRRAGSLSSIGSATRRVSIAKPLTVDETRVEREKFAAALDKAQRLAALQEEQADWDNLLKTRKDIFLLSHSLFGMEDRRTLEAGYTLAMLQYDMRAYADCGEVVQALFAAKTLVQFGELRASMQLLLGNVLCALDRDDEALTFYQQCCASIEARLGRDHPSLSNPLMNIGLIHSRAGRDDQALRVFQRAKIMAESVLGSNVDRLVLADIYHNMGFVYDNKGSLSIAAEYYGKALNLRFRYTGDSLDTAATLCNLAQIELDNGEFRSARERLERVCSVREHHLGVEHVLTVDAMMLLAICLLELREHQRAETLLQRCERARIKQFGANSEQVEQVREELARIRGSKRPPVAAAPKPAALGRTSGAPMRSMR